MKILIADDDPDLTTALAMRCRQRGWTAIIAHEGFKALEYARADKPDVVCLDVEMPSGRGLAVSEMMQTDGDLCTIPMIILTGRDDPNTIRRCHELGLYYVLKCTDSWERLEPLLEEFAERLEKRQAKFIESL
jgi:DNA-binding response OmpR family regulator